MGEMINYSQLSSFWATHLPLCRVDCRQSTLEIFNIYTPILIILVSLDMWILEAKEMAVSEPAVRNVNSNKLTRTGIPARSMLLVRALRY